MQQRLVVAIDNHIALLFEVTSVRELLAVLLLIISYFKKMSLFSQYV